MVTAESAFVEALSELEVLACATKSAQYMRITELCRLAEAFVVETREIKLAMLKDVEDEIAHDAAHMQKQWEIDPFACYTRA